METLILLTGVASLLLAGLPGLGLLAVVIGLWLWFGPRGRERWRVAAFLTLALGLLSAGWLAERAAMDPERKKAAIQRQFGGIWTELDLAAAEAAAALEDPAVEAGFGPLIDISRRHAGRLTFLLVDRGGTPLAWAGAGLLHDLEQEPLPAHGRSFRLGFQSVTLFSVAQMPGGGAQRVLVGRSLSKNDLPERDRFLGPIRWTVFRSGDVVPPDLIEVSLGPGPTIALEDWSARREAADRWISRARRWGAVALGLALAFLALARALRGAVGGDPLLIAGAAGALAIASRLEPVTGVLLMLAAALALGAWRPTGRLIWVPPWLLGLVGTGAVGLVALMAQRSRAPLDLGDALLPGHEGFAWRLILFGLTLAWMAFAARARSEAGNGSAESHSGKWGWAAVGMVLLAAAVHDQHLVAVTVVLGAAAGFAAVWVSRQARPLSFGAATVVCLIAALLSATSWETVYRKNLKYHLSSVVLPGLARPDAGDVELLRQSLHRHFSELDVDSLALTNPAGHDSQDLGIAVWRDSPLAVRGALSAVSARPFGSAPSSFSYGLPLTSDGDVDWTPTRWRKVEEPSPEGFVTSGSTRFLNGGRPWADVSYTLLMRPGFELSRRPIRSLAAGLLRGGPGPFRPDPKLIEPAVYGLYEPSGDAIEAAWPGVKLPLEEMLADPGLSFRGPDGPAVGFAAQGSDGVQVLLLPLLSPVAALERVGTHGVALLGALALLMAAAWLVSLRGRPRVGAAAFILRSYSRRMLLFSSLLLLVPVLLLNTFALRVLSDHMLHEQRTAGESALESAQRVLGEYILALDPGFGIETILDDELLGWLSRVVHHEINLYWGSSVYASSKGELFSAGLLPKRIPGEIYAELALGEARQASRINRAGHTEYLELYGPLSIPGQPAPSRLFLSVPLLAQQVETMAELGSLRRRVLLATTALALLLLAVGSRLARGFTAPLLQIVTGTQRIAGGAESLDLQPADRELATLVDAIDEMARKIAIGRQRLLREKAVVERVIDNVNSGVVSLDDRKRVVLINQVARDLLKAEVGDSLQEVLDRTAGLARVAGFLEQAAEESRLQTVQLPGEEGEESEWTLVWVPLPGGGEPSSLLVVEDVTEVLRGQRLEAWAEMARIIAHEIKNPLTPIRLSAEHMRQVRAEQPAEFDRVFERCTSNILDQVNELQQISTEFSSYSRLPKIDPQPGDLGETVRKVVDGYRSSVSESVRLDLGDELGARFDGKLLGRALRNLIENALRATANGSGVEVRVGREGDRMSIRVLDDGPGVSVDDLPRIFDPYFSTHDTGTGLGLPIARRIAEEHGGGVHARNRPEGGLEVELWIPASSPTALP